MQVKGVIFDNDGLILDSEQYSIDVSKGIFAKLGIEYDEKLFNDMLGITNDDCMKLLAAAMGEKKAQLYLDMFEQILKDDMQNGCIPLKKGAVEIIDYLNRHQMPYCLATSGSSDKVSKAFNHTAFKGNPFHYFITGDQIEKGKPDPEIFLKAADLIGVDIKNCLIAEDSYNGIRAAHRSGGIAVMVPDILQPDEEISSLADFVVDDLFAVIDLIERFSD